MWKIGARTRPSDAGVRRVAVPPPPRWREREKRCCCRIRLLLRRPPWDFVCACPLPATKTCRRRLSGVVRSVASLFRLLQVLISGLAAHTCFVAFLPFFSKAFNEVAWKWGIFAVAAHKRVHRALLFSWVKEMWK